MYLPIRIIHLTTIVPLLLLLTACSGGGGGSVPAPQVVSITSFSSSVSNITAGDSTNLTAVFKNGTGVIDNGVGIVESGVALSITPSATTTYTLTVTSSVGVSVTSQLDITVVPAPIINSFSSSLILISAGDSVNLIADFSNGTASIDNSVGAVLSGAGVTVTPATTTTYTLSVTNSLASTVTSAITVTVVSVPTILSFNSAAATITNGDSVNLTAIFAGGTGSIDNGVGLVTSETPISVTPTVDTTYTITVLGTGGLMASATVSVAVVAAPTITSFITSNAKIAEGASVNLTATFADGTASIDNGVGVVVSGTPVSVIPATDTTYTLTVTNAAGTIVTSTVSVTVILAPTITSFVSSSTAISNVSSIDFTAVFANGTGSVDNGVGVILSGTPLTVTPTTTTTYTLTVTNSLGITLTSTVTITVTDVTLDSLSILNASLEQAFQSNQLSYTSIVGFLTKSVTVTTTTATAGATITVNGVAIGANNTSQIITLNEGSNDISVVVTASNGITSTYTVTINRDVASTFAEQAYVKASNIGFDVRFGTSVGLSGDTMVVGTILEGKGGTTPGGAVYVFTRNGASWTQQAFLKASNIEATDFFGYSVAISGDTLAVGAYGEDSGTNANSADNTVLESGAVYVYTRTGTTWTEQAYLKASNIGTNDRFGATVSISGNTLAVAAHLEDSSNSVTVDEAATDSGAVYVFTRTGSNWSEQAYLKASNIGAMDNFGFSIALSGDNLVVGAYREDSSSSSVTIDEGAPESGAAYIFTRTGTSWSEQAYLKASNIDATDNFGSSVAISGDTVAVGARLEDSSTNGISAPIDDLAFLSGAVYVFTRTGSNWTQQAYLKAGNIGTEDNFGTSVALFGDTLAIGAEFEDSSTSGINTVSNEAAIDSGAVYVFTRTGTSWTQQLYIKASNTGSIDYFSKSVALSSDTLIVGAHYEDGIANNVLESGAVYVFK